MWVVGVGLGGRGCTSVAEDGGGNPLVVGRQDTVGAFSGLRVVEDAAQLVADNEEIGRASCRERV